MFTVFGGTDVKQIIIGLVALAVIRCSAFADVPKSIFDDDWKPAGPTEPEPSQPGTPAPNLPLPTTPAPTSTPSTPARSTVAPSHEPAAPLLTPLGVARVPVPTPDAQADSWRLIKADLYKDDIANARTSGQKVELARTLLAVAEGTTNDMIAKYVLLAQAKELAIGSGDPPTAFKCLDELGKYYDIDYPAMKLQLFVALARTVGNPADGETLVAGLNQWADNQVKKDGYAAARSACDIALGVARSNRQGRLVNKTSVHEKQIGIIEAWYLRTKSTIVQLENRPMDPALNLAVGRFYCFIKADWDRGLPMLAAGSDREAKALALKELAGISMSDAQVALGNRWWEFAEKEKGLERDRIREHAISWYDEAMPGLEGLAKAKVEKRILAAQNEAPGGQNTLFSCTFPVERVERTADGAIELRDGKRITTEEKFVPPVEFVLVAQTDSTNIRLAYAAKDIIFNWEDNPDELRIDGGPADGRHMRNFGRLPTNQWVEIALQFLPNSLTISIDGTKRYQTTADFSRVKEPLSIWPDHGSIIKVRSVVAQEPAQ